ncbi:MAG: NAD(P)-binding protein [Myxococcota bacterium]|nr:NAD(P)-binding protein [Myxococcota bacterium]
MRTFSVLRAFLPLLASIPMLTACNDEVDSPTHDAITAATPGVSSALLSSKHKGWGDADCAKCHTQFHSGLLAEAQCGFCHGGNGAPGRPAGHSDEDCQTCHAQSHSGLGFSAPADCRFCHGYEPVAGNACAFEESYDVVIIGAGGGGLSAATTLIDEGLSVALLEQGVQVGGSMVRFRRGDYDFEASLHAFDGMGLSNLEKLGIDEAVKPLVGEVMYRAIYPDFTLDVPADVTAYRTLLKKHFPDDAAGIDALLDNFSSFNFSVYADMRFPRRWTAQPTGPVFHGHVGLLSPVGLLLFRRRIGGHLERSGR